MKNYNGGYLIIDLKDNDLTGEAFTLSGVYEAIEGNYRKPILFSGITIDGVEKADVFAQVETSDTNFVVKLYDRTVTITSSDVVSSVEGGNHLYLYNINDDSNTFSFKFVSPIYMGSNKVNLDDTTDIPQNILKNLYDLFKNYYLSTYESNYAMINVLSAVKDDGGEDDTIGTLKISYNSASSYVKLVINGNINGLVENEISIDDDGYKVTLTTGYAYITCSQLF